MDLSDYFNVVRKDQNVLHFQLKNFWSDRVASKIGQLFLEEFAEEVNLFNKRKFIILADLTNFSTPGGQYARTFFEKAMLYSIANGLYKSVEIIPKALIRIGANNMVKWQMEKNDIDLHDIRFVVTEMAEAEELIDRFIVQI